MSLKRSYSILAVPEYNEKERIGTLEDKGDIFVNKKYRMICAEARTENFPAYSIRNLRELKSELEYIQKHIFENDCGHESKSIQCKM